MTTTTETTSTEPGPRIGGHSPWGTIDHVKRYLNGVSFVGTPGHGGYKLSAAMNRKIPEPLRRKGGWYEEDCDYAIVDRFLDDMKAVLTPEQIAAADKAVRGWHPDEYTEATGIAVSVEESPWVLGPRAFRAAHTKDWVGVSAVGDWHAGVPKGMVGVTACIGGRTEHGQYAGDELRAFLVPQAEYDQRSDHHGFVVDPTRHQQVDKDTFLPTTKRVG